MADKDKDTAVIVPAGRLVKEGVVKRRVGRMHQWNTRYFQLHENRLVYKLKQDTATVRGTFELVPGTIVTDIIEESLVKMKSTKLYSFWVVNPSGNDKGSVTDEKNYESDEEDDKEVTTASAAGAVITTTVAPANRKLQSIVRNELETQKRQKESAEEQIELHQAHDSSTTQGAMVAAVAVGGVVVGAMTMVCNVPINSFTLSTMVTIISVPPVGHRPYPVLRGGGHHGGRHRRSTGLQPQPAP
jgi:hypothetical protein